MGWIYPDDNWRRAGSLRRGSGTSLDQLVRALFADPAAQGGVYDISDPRTVWSGPSAQAVIGQSAYFVHDSRYNFSKVERIALIDQFAFNPYGTTPPTTNAAATFLGVPCVSVTFPVLASGGYAVSRGNGDGGAAQLTAVVGGSYEGEFECALSRPLVGGETLIAYVTGTFGTQNLSLTSATPSGVWIPTGMLRGVNAVNNGLVYPTVFAATAIGSPVTVYVRRFTAREYPGNHLYQNTAPSRPLLLEVGGKRLLRFDGVDDQLLRAGMAWGLNMDRVSGWKTPPNVTTLSHLISAQGNYGGVLLIISGAIRAYGTSSINALTSVTASTLGVAVERYTSTSAGIQWNNAAPVSTALSGYTNGNGVSVGASYTLAAPAAADWYGAIMRGGVASMTDAEIAICRAWAAERCGATIAPPSPGITARYWGIRINANNGATDFTMLRSIVFAITPGAARSHTDTTKYADPNYLGEFGNTWALAFCEGPSVDVNDGKRWMQYQSAMPYLNGYDFSVATTIREVRVTGIDVASNAAYGLRDFDIVYSTNGTTWTTAQAVTGKSWTEGETLTLTIP